MLPATPNLRVNTCLIRRERRTKGNSNQFEEDKMAEHSNCSLVLDDDLISSIKEYSIKTGIPVDQIIQNTLRHRFEEKKSKSCFVCFADIMGYSNILENNDIEKCHIILNEIIRDMPEKIKVPFLNRISRIKGGDAIEKMYLKFVDKRIRHILVSDSIIFFFDIEDLDALSESAAEFEGLIDIVLMNTFLSYFILYCFEKGIPVRACLDYGEVYFVDNIFAGKVIVNGYKKSSDMEFSGLVYTEEAAKKCIEFVNEIQSSSELVQYTVPFKSCQNKCWLLNWWQLTSVNLNQEDVFQFLFKSFNMHNKDADESVMKKINNTEKTIRYFFMRNEAEYYYRLSKSKKEAGLIKEAIANYKISMEKCETNDKSLRKKLNNLYSLIEKKGVHTVLKNFII